MSRWSSIGMDFIVDLPPTRDRKFNSIVTFVDRATKRAHFIPSYITDTAHDVAKLFIKEVVRLHGCPLSIVSDRDRRFVSSFWSSLMKLLGVTLKMSSAMHPQTDGLTERLNRIIEELLRHYVSFYQDDWDHWLPILEFAYNSAVQSSTKMSPFVADIGRNPNSPLVWKHFGLSKAKDQSTQDLVDKLNSIFNTTLKNLEIAQLRMKKNSDKNRKDIEFQVGDLVLLDRGRINLDYFREMKRKKFLSKMLGPFEVIQKIGKVAYKLKLPSKSTAHPVFHVSALQKYHLANDG